MKKVYQDFEEIELTKNGKFVCMFNRSEFIHEFGMTPEGYNQKSQNENSHYRAKIHQYRQKITIFG